MSKKEKSQKQDISSKKTQEKQDKDKEISLSNEELKKLCEEKICPECAQLKEKEELVLRTLADAENLKKRLAREKEEFCKFATSTLLEDLLPIIDNLELALSHSQKQNECASLTEGIEMTLKMFRDVLKKYGLIPVGEVGEKFDPNIHEAMAQEEREDMEEGMVCQMYQRGYKLHDRLLRPARVIVSKKCAK
ncbi:molecular chaperone GrpE [Desulfonauticus submarinus]|uniref:Protein GrpE n=1 Tax=Desulfonauticus submarinus TaxID=206665 RepID=A0A1H0CLD5_9BACT|nr:nucleotide exchange factor GrpE [Desulfonauticus submarinus]SDN58690.1 molecular chaperone GrpE [Desulfonauticus submarinus]